MNTHRAFLPIAVLAAALAGFSFVSTAAADGHQCYLQAPEENDVYVEIYDEDGEGNRINQIWQGSVKAGQQQLITSATGRVRYDMSFSANQPAEGDIADWCDEMNTIGIMP
jgi:uncharacterized membrane protein